MHAVAGWAAGFLGRADAILRSRAGDAAPLALARQALVWGALYGAVMGTFSGLAPGRLLQVVYSALKVPLLFLSTLLLCLPVFCVLNTLLGLRGDLRVALRALLVGQATLAIVLCSCAPLTAVVYLSTGDYQGVLLWNGALFALSALCGQVVVSAAYRPLVRRDPRHRLMLSVWLALYMGVAIQLAWVLRPYVGAPQAPVELFRAASWGNAYLVILRLLLGAG